MKAPRSFGRAGRSGVLPSDLMLIGPVLGS